MAKLALESACTISEVCNFLIDRDVAYLRGVATLFRNAAADFTVVTLEFNKPYYKNPTKLHQHILRRLRWVRDISGSKLSAVRFLRNDWHRHHFHMPPQPPSNEVSIIASFGNHLAALHAGWIMTDTGIAAITVMCPNLIKLYIPYSSISSEGILSLRGLRLTHLDLAGVIRDDFQLSVVSSISTLVHLNVRKCSCSSAALTLLGGLQDLQELDLLEAPGVTDEVIVRVAQGCNKLQKLIIGNQLSYYSDDAINLDRLTERGLRSLHSSCLSDLTCLGHHGPRYIQSRAMLDLACALCKTLRHFHITVSEHHISAAPTGDGSGVAIKVWSRHSKGTCKQEIGLICKAFPQVKALLLESRLSGKILGEIQKHCKSLLYVSIGCCDDCFDDYDCPEDIPDVLQAITRKDFLRLGGCKQLQILRLKVVPKILLKSIPPLLSLLPCLRCLQLDHADARDEDIKEITVAAPSLQHFQISAHARCQDHAMEGGGFPDDDDERSILSSEFSDEEELERVRRESAQQKAAQIHKAHLTDESFVHLGSLRSLSFLLIEGGRFSDGGLARLSTCTELRDLCVRAVAGGRYLFTDAALKSLNSLSKLDPVVVRPGSVQTRSWGYILDCCQAGGFANTSRRRAPAGWLPTLHVGTPLVPSDRFSWSSLQI